MKLFKRKHKEEKIYPARDKLAKRIMELILKIQNCFAKIMSKRTEKISASAMKLGLVIFFLTGGGLSVYFVVSAFLNKEQSKAIKVDRLSVPRYYDKNGDEPIQLDYLITKKEHEEMQFFQNYMDSLQKTKSGRMIYDSILLYRPGLMDSLNKLDQFYQQQLHNKK